jgi:hypothetical protein
VKAERLPAWALRRLNAEQRRAYDLLRYGDATPADRARAKDVLGWRPTGEERLALARELLADGLPRRQAAEAMGVGVRYLDRLLRTAGTRRDAPKTPPVSRGFVGLSDTAKGIALQRGARPPLEGFASVAELDAWLEEHR